MSNPVLFAELHEAIPRKSQCLKSNSGMRREASELKKLKVRSIDIDLRCFTIETLLVIAFVRNKLPEVKHSSKTKKNICYFRLPGKDECSQCTNHLERAEHTFNIPVLSSTAITTPTFLSLATWRLCLYFTIYFPHVINV